MGGTKRYRVRIKGPFGPFVGMDVDELAETAMKEMDEVREEEWELTDEQAARFVREDGYAYVMTVFREGTPQLCLTQKEVWEDPASFAGIVSDAALSPEQKREEIQRLIMERMRATVVGDSELAEHLVRAILFSALQALFDEELWCMMGFRKRPRRGRWFRRFVKPQQLALEDFFKRELVILAFSQMAKSVKRRCSREVSTPVLSRALEAIIDGPIANDPFWEALAFPSRAHAAHYLIEGIQSYLPLPNDRMGPALLDRAEPVLFTDKLKAKFLARAFMFTSQLDPDPLPLLDRYPIGRAVDIRVADAGIVELVDGLPSPP
jgi:hypothetical protein